MANLQRAVEKVTQGKSPKKADGRKCRRYAEASAQRLPQLQLMLKEGRYELQPALRIWIPKLGSKEMRPLGVADGGRRARRRGFGPPPKALTAEQVGLIRAWIDQGAK